ncbi:MAG: nicotinate-nucleotide adenylyltransferase [Anaerolineales bacterium]|jgi:nicotinate-nucleotide adenylyltransferase
MARLIGVFGGTFDPPHVGHLILADTGRIALGERLDKVLWVVAADPPHKPEDPITGIDLRLAMVAAAIEHNPFFELSRADVDRVGPHYTVDTIAWLQQRNPEDRFILLLGSDSLRDLLAWHQPRKLVESCEALGVMRRPDAEVLLEDLKPEIPGIVDKVRFFDAPLVDISGREIRRRVREGLPYRYLVHPAVADIIAEQGLYPSMPRQPSGR